MICLNQNERIQEKNDIDVKKATKNIKYVPNKGMYC